MRAVGIRFGVDDVRSILSCGRAVVYAVAQTDTASLGGVDNAAYGGYALWSFYI